MDFGLIGSVFLALAAYRVAAPVLDRMANRLWGNPYSAAMVAHGCTRAAKLSQGVSKATG